MSKSAAFATVVLGFSVVLGACPAPTSKQVDTPAPPQAPAVVVAVPARAGAVDNSAQNSDEFIWRIFADFTAPAAKDQPSPVVFETWASDDDTYATRPHWPSPNEPKDLHSSVLGALSSPVHGRIDVKCAAPGNALVGGFPTAGTPAPCIAEEVRRNRPQFDFIVSNNLYSRAGLKAAYARQAAIVMPTTAVSVKGDWVPVQALLQWIPALGSITNIQALYYTTKSDAVEYALVSLHVSSRQNPNWVWGTFEHRMNPGRCDAIGCFDTFGAMVPAIPPNRSAVNSQYGECIKTPALKAVMARAGSAAVWENYCLKSTEVDYASADGTPYVLGNSVIEGIVGNGTIAASSCIACHVYASFDSTGTVRPGVQAMLPFNPTGSPIAGVLAGSLQYDFMWGVLLAK